MAGGSARLRLERDGADWPHRDRSLVARVDGTRWHVQRWPAPTPDAPTALLIHGTGAATHSWAGLAPLLARRAAVIAPDLPGHGFTDAPAWPSRQSLPGMAASLGALLDHLDVAPDLVVGHSAGAAIAFRMTLDGRIAPRLLIALNGALKPFQGLAGVLFPQIARLLFLNPLTPRVFAASARDPRRVARLLEGTGSTSPPELVALYGRLFRNPGHVAGALSMMAHWDLSALAAEAPRLRTPVVFLAGARDRTIPPSDAQALAERLPRAEAVTLPGLGHLAHEEDPQTVAAAVFDRMPTEA